MQRLKKYPNRRLYNTNESRYVTVDDVRKLIVSGESIKVEDSKDGSDLTRSVLLQILSEQESQGHEPILTNRAIEQIIRFYGDRMGGIVSRYIEQSILTFLDHQDQFRARMKKLNDLNPLNLMRQAFETTVGNPGDRQATSNEPSASEEDSDPPKSER
ncbi:MAG: polyhydroxyalkanoate synthesis repressor PhaR [Pseudomonadales bacterium]